MERPDGNTVSVPPWHPIEHPDCENCNGLSRPVRKKKPCKCPLVQIRLSHSLAFRKHAQAIMKQAAIPRDTFATRILGTTPSTLWRQLKGGCVPKVTQTQLQSIEYVRREGSKVFVIFEVGNLGPRWDATLKRRAHVAKLAHCAPKELC